MELTCEISLGKIFYPKYVSRCSRGDFCIFTSKVLKAVEGCGDIKELKLKGNLTCDLEYGNTYKVKAKLSDSNPKYGNTFEIISIFRKIDISDKDKQKEFLGNILTEKQVDSLFDMYDDVIGLLESKDIESLVKVKGIGDVAAQRIISEYEDSKDHSHIYLELGKLGLTTTMVKKLFNFYGDPETVVDVVRNNPYSLVSVEGIGFKKADEIALSVGIPKQDPRRVGGYIIHYLSECGESGKSFVEYTELMSAIYETLGFVPEEIMKSIGSKMVESGKLHLSNDAQFVGLKKYWVLENKIKNELLRLKKGEIDYTREDYIPKKFDYSNIEEKIQEIEKEQGFEFTDKQRDGILAIEHENIVVITGGAGCGKSANANGILNVLDDALISCCALSGKASVRIVEATGLEASTIHRLLCYGRGGFKYNNKNKLNADVVLMDEATMTNGSLFLSLLEAIPTGAKVIFMGDVQQLTPVGNCQVFADMLASGTFKTVVLDKPHRQALRSGIIPLSMKISNQQPIFKSGWVGNEIVGELQDMELYIYNGKEDVQKLILEYFKRELEKFKNVMEVQVCTSMRYRGLLSCYELNNLLQQYYNPKDAFASKSITKNVGKGKEYDIRVGDKVINTKNNYNAHNLQGEIVGVFNGNIGIVMEIKNGACIVDFEGIGVLDLSKDDAKHLELAYALTIHKCQGSGFDSVIVAMDSSSYIMNNAELLYTGVTRAKKYCTLIGDCSAIQKAIKTKEVKKKQTYLKYIL